MKRSSTFKPFVFALPYVVICALFVVFPLVLVLVYAFQQFQTCFYRKFQRDITAQNDRDRRAYHSRLPAYRVPDRAYTRVRAVQSLRNPRAFVHNPDVDELRTQDNRA